VTQERFARFFRAVAADDVGRSFADAGIAVAFEAPEIGSRIVLDASAPASGAPWFTVREGDEPGPEPDVTFRGSAESFDRVLRGKLGVVMALASRKIVATGSVARAMRLVPAFEQCLDLYEKTESAPVEG
jgi:hypothetical protein